jgi:hypothetical protein
MTLVRVLLASLITGSTIVVFTLVYLWFWVRGARATSLELLTKLTIYSPIYWLLLTVVLVGIWFLVRGWLKASV